MQNKLALIGSGNAFFKDEGVGLYAVKYIKENYHFEPDIEIVDGGTLGFKLMPLLQEFENVIIVNTSSEELKNAGEIRISTSDEFLDGSLIKKTANEVEIVEMLQLCSLTDNMAKTTIISIVPEDIIAVAVDLSQSMKSAFTHYVAIVVKHIQKCGIKVTKKEKLTTLDEILFTFANPSIEHQRGF